MTKTGVVCLLKYVGGSGTLGEMLANVLVLGNGI